MFKKRKKDDLNKENLVYAVKTITPVIALIREVNTNEELSSSKYYDIVDRVCEYDDYAEIFANYINIEIVRSLLEEENFNKDQKLAMLYLIFNSAVRYKIRKKMAVELEKEFPEEIEAMKKYSYTNSGLENFIK